jgi:hypothetical protein
MAELPGGEYPGVARNQTAVLAHQRRRRPAPLLDARGYRGDLGIRVGPSIFGIRDQPIDRPALDLVGRPRPLISDSLSRAGARAPREGKCWLDTMAFGIPQRRKRVIIVGARKSDPRAVLFCDDVGDRIRRGRARTPRGFYWTEGRSGIGQRRFRPLE